MSKHERRAPRRSQLKLKVEGKDSAVQMARTGVLSGAKTATATANGANRLASACSVAGAKSATPTACVTSAKMALGLRQTSHSAGHWRFLPPFFFCGCCKFFFHAPLYPHDSASFWSELPAPCAAHIHIFSYTYTHYFGIQTHTYTVRASRPVSLAHTHEPMLMSLQVLFFLFLGWNSSDPLLLLWLFLLFFLFNSASWIRM